MSLLNVLFEELYDSDKNISSRDLPDGFGIPITPVVSYFCFNEPLDTVYYKDEVLKEEILEERNKSVEKTAMKKAKKEMSYARRGKTSKETGTVYRLTREQRRALRFIRKKYGKEIVSEIKTFRKNFLAPYQVIKNNLEKSKSIYPKEVLGMSKEEYLRAKRRAEYKIENMRSNKYQDLSKEYMSVSKRGEGIDKLKSTIKNSKGDLNGTALRRVFDKYKLSSRRFSDSDFLSVRNKIKDRNLFLKKLLDKIENDSEISQEDLKKLQKKVSAIETSKRGMIKAYREKTEVVTDDLDKVTSDITSIENEIQKTDLSDELKRGVLDTIDGYVSVRGNRITSKTFANEYEMFLIREKIKNQIKSGESNKYADEYLYQLGKSKERNVGRREELLGAMARERLSKNLTDEEKKIYELKRGAPRDSDKLEDYILKIKEEDFFEPIFFSKSDEMRDAERKIDAEIKRFERGLQSKMEEKDFRLLKKYNLINNLLTVKDLQSIKKMFAEKK